MWVVSGRGSAVVALSVACWRSSSWCNLLSMSAEQLAADFAAVREQVENEIRSQVMRFLNETLPSIKIPDVSNEKEPLKFSVSGLQITDQEIAEDDIEIEFGDLMQLEEGEVLRVTTRNVTARLLQFPWSYELMQFPFAFGDGRGDVSLTGGSIAIGFRIEPVEAGNSGLFSALGAGGGGSGSGSGAGAAELRVSSSEVQIEKISLDVSDSYLAWVYNALLFMVEGMVKDAVLGALNEQLQGNIAEAMKPLNEDERVRAALGMLLKGLERGVRRASAAHDTMRRASAALPPDAAAVAAAAADD